jgi:two-component system, chemotaxis family, response regulator Rcp1
MRPVPSRQATVMLVEDSPSDVRLAQEALIEAGVACHLVVACDGMEAMEYLRRHGEALPDLVLLDLNMPRMRGDELLAELKRNPALRRIPVIVLTTSKARMDVVTCYDLHANCYVAKPLRLEDFVEVVSAIWRFWFGVATLPSVFNEGDEDEDRY